jgi:hypothetical protein
VCHIAAFTVEARSENEDVYITLGSGVGVKVRPYYARTTAVQRLELRRYADSIYQCFLNANECSPPGARPSTALAALAAVFDYAYRQDPLNHTNVSLVNDVSSVLLGFEGPMTVYLSANASDTHEFHPLLGADKGIALEFTGFHPHYNQPNAGGWQLFHFLNYYVTFVNGGIWGVTVGQVGDIVHECIGEENLAIILQGQISETSLTGIKEDARLTSVAFELAHSQSITPENMAFQFMFVLSQPRPGGHVGALAPWYYDNSFCGWLAREEWDDRNPGVPYPYSDVPTPSFTSTPVS